MNFKEELNEECNLIYKQDMIENSNPSYDIFENLKPLIIEIRNNYRDIPINNLIQLLHEVIQILLCRKEIPDYFVNQMDCLSLFTKIIQDIKNSDILESSLIILQCFLYYSPISLFRFIELDLFPMMLNYFVQSDEENYDEIIITTLLGIFKKLFDERVINLDLETLPHLFKFVETHHNPSDFSESLNICFGIFDAFIRNHDKEILNNFFQQFINIRLYLTNPSYEKITIPIICDLAEKGFSQEIIECGVYNVCLDLLNNIAFKKSHHYVFRLIIQILNATSNFVDFVPFARICNVLDTERTVKNKMDALLLYEKIASLGGLKLLLDENVSNNQSLLIKFLENDKYVFKSQIFHFLWNGLFKLNFVDQIFIMNSVIFQQMTFYIDFVEDSDVFIPIFMFLQSILEKVPNNPNVDGINGKLPFGNFSPQYRLNDNALICINQFVNNCSESENEDLMSSAIEFLKKFDVDE